MKSVIIVLFLAASTTLLASNTHAQSTSKGLTREQVRADLYRAFLNGTTAEDEKASYPAPPDDRADLAAQRAREARSNPAYANFVR
ncbi:DUF4148 domain-containing protein [Paraburkholderia silvatlantica]|uniref:DUF4148 domain-containing protein n=1 Tax=Paraburkholderia silvatlantica TaxID=321895 RepID=A0ABR6FM12_9BURK|nr:DUF4148 domain-containing protein [Paraburkholderia silvatlantica]MBB2928142.1 hypothetical protein [Paraburkholderia silvatlantica]PVY31099.1 uncharacterized protein DUF4148 [Paraburkholderia silvatlantica]PXW37235.1 uncharacterized protein DUF4148 [Paraburkholderia silvatlantica]TDQ89547.1 uncharacterized protein DUF4148 [Paraburkholderia silvatlantica]